MRTTSWLLVALSAAAVFANSVGAVESPQWWKDNRSIYAQFALSGAGGPLMKYGKFSSDIKKKLKGSDETSSFVNLPNLLQEASQLGCNCIYLVDYWEGGYENKGDYVPRSDLGGPTAFRTGVAALHAQGGKIIVYLEAFLVTRTNPVGVAHADWAMKDENGEYYTYYGRDRFYLMYPGEGSGWTDYICGLAEQMVRDYGVDGFHLDSYGCQWDRRDYNANHPCASDPAKFNAGAIRLVQTMRQRIQAINPNAVVILECCERTELLDVCDGGQIESAAWLYSPVKVLNEKPWVSQRKYKAFTSHYSMVENEKILRMGYNLSLSPWFLQNPPSQSDYDRMRERIDDKSEWIDRITELWYWDNLLYINGVPRPSDVDLFQLRRDLDMAQYGSGPHYDTPAYFEAVEAYVPLIEKLYTSGKPVKTMAQFLREIQACKE